MVFIINPHPVPLTSISVLPSHLLLGLLKYIFTYQIKFAVYSSSMSWVLHASLAIIFGEEYKKGISSLRSFLLPSVAASIKPNNFIFKYNQQDSALHKLFISVKCSTCFRRFLRPSSGAQKLYIQHRVLCQTFSATCHCRSR